MKCLSEREPARCRMNARHLHGLGTLGVFGESRAERFVFFFERIAFLRKGLSRAWERSETGAGEMGEARWEIVGEGSFPYAELSDDFLELHGEAFVVGVEVRVEFSELSKDKEKDKVGGAARGGCE